MRQTVVRWREALQLQPNYLVGLTRDPLPFKYEIIDGQMVVMHEAIGVSDLHRLNALFIQSEIVGGEFENDFEVIWDRIPTPLRSKQGVVDWIDANLVPLLDAKGGRPMKSRARATGDI